MPFNQRNSKSFFDTWWFDSFIFIILITIFGVLAVHFGQDNNWDLRDYHFYNGFAFVHHRIAWDILPAMMQTYFNPYFDVFNYYLISTQDPKITTFVMGAISGATCFLLYKISLLFLKLYQDWQKAIYVFFIIAIGSTGAAGWPLIGTTTNDNKAALLSMIALFFALKANLTNHKTELFYLILAGLCIGIVSALKLTAICYAIGLFVAFLFNKSFNRKNFITFIIFSIAFLAGFLIADGYWTYTLYKMFHNPFFPLFNNIFHSPDAPVNYSGRDWRFYSTHYLTLPFQLAFERSAALSEIPIKDKRLFTIYVLALIFLAKYVYQHFLTRKVSNNSTIKNPTNNAIYFLAIWLIASYFSWLGMFAIYRFIIPIELITSFFITYLILQIFKNDILRIIVLLTLIIIYHNTTVYPNWGRLKFAENFYTVSHPPIANNSLVMIVSVPIAYVIPYFPPSIRFIAPAPHHLLEQKTADVINHHQGPIYSLGNHEYDYQSLLNKFNLEQTGQTCGLVKTNTGDSLQLCRLMVRR